MPLRQGLPLREPAISATRGQPVEFLGLVYRQQDTVCNLLRPVRIIAAPALFKIEQFAGNISVIRIARIFVFNLMQTTKRTAVAQAFPLLGRHLRQRFAIPVLIVHRQCSL